MKAEGFAPRFVRNVPVHLAAVDVVRLASESERPAEIVQAHLPASAEAARTGEKVKMISYKGAATRVQMKDGPVTAAYLLVDQAAVMDGGFSRVGRGKTASRCRRSVGRPAASCD